MKILSWISDYTGIFIISTSYIAILEGYLLDRVDYVPLLAGLITPIIIFTYLKRYPKRFPLFFSGPESEGIAPYIIVLIASLVEILYLLAYPIFPGNPSRDFLVYTSKALELMTNGRALIKIRNPVIYVILSSVYSLFSNYMNPLTLGRTVIFIFTITIYPMAYELSELLYGKYAGIITLITLLFSNFFWLLTYSYTGLYANLTGVIMVLYLLIIVTRYEKIGDGSFLVLIILTLFIALLSHETSWLMIPLILIGGVYEALANRKIKLLKVFTSTILLIIPILLIFSFERHVTSFILYNLTHLRPVLGWRATEIIAMNPVYQVLSRFSPFMAYLYLGGGTLAVGILVASLIIGLYLVYRKEDSQKILTFILVLLVWILSVFIDNEWRLTGYALYPAVIVIGSLNRFCEWINTRTSIKKLDRYTKYALLWLIILLLLANSNLLSTIQTGIEEVNHSPRLQRDIYDTMLWISKNTPTNASVVSIGRWEFIYTNVLTQRRYLGDFYMYPDEFLEYLQNSRIENVVYLAIWNLLMDKNNMKTLKTYYDNDPHYTEVYHNEMITVYKVNL
jgi:hypothetical protein